MAELTETDRRDMQSAAANALVGAGDQALRADLAALGVGDIKDFFCKHWDEIKKVLQFIADQVGGIVALAVRGIIAAGDLLKGRICSG